MLDIGDDSERPMIYSLEGF